MEIQGIHIILTVLVFILGGAFLVSYVVGYSQRKRMHLTEKKMLHQQFDEELVKTRMEVQEQTLKTIAAEIHDNAGQLLSLSKLTLGTIDIGKDPERAKQKVESALTLLDASIKELRQLSSVMYADNLLASGLEEAIEKELLWIGRTGRFKVDFQCYTEPPKEIDKQKSLIAFRIVQELFNNIVKHANAKEIAVRFEYQEIEVKICVQDNGKGFEIAPAIERPTGLGLTTLFKRAKMIGGELTLTSELGIGTKAALAFPY